MNQTQFTNQRTQRNINTINNNIGGGSNAEATFGTNNNAEQKFLSFVNTEFKYNPTVTSLCPKEHKGICLYSFTDTCSNESLLYSNFCKHHNELKLERGFVLTQLNNGIETVPIPIKRAQYKPLMITSSMMPLNMTIEQIEHSLSQISGWSSEEKNQICRLYSIFSLNPSLLVNSAHTTVFKTYISELVLQCQEQLSEMMPLINNTFVPIVMSNSQYELAKKNNAWWDGLDPYDDTNEDVKLFVIPLSHFNMLDIEIILSYHLVYQKKGISFAPNCKIVNYQYVHGTGCGIHNAMENYMPIFQDNGLRQYPDIIRESMEKDRFLSNLDIETMLCFKNNDSTPTDLIPKPILIKVPPKNIDFDIRKIIVSQE